MSGANTAASIIISAPWAQVITRVMDSFKRDKILKREFISLVQTLKRNVSKIEQYSNAMVLGDQNNFLGDEDGCISGWYMELKDKMYAALDALADYAIADKTKSMNTLKDKLKNFIYTCFIHLVDVHCSLSLARAIRLINVEIDKLFEEGEKHDYRKWIESRVTTYPELRSRPTSIPFDDHPIRGRYKIHSEILGKLKSDIHMKISSTGLTVVPIVGMGGIGKTTLTQSVYNFIKGRFDRSGWVLISSSSGTKSILCEILSEFGQTNAAGSLEKITKSLVEAVADKKFLLVLDDVWSKQNIKWDELLTPLKRGKTGSKLIITTREMDVVGSIKTCHRGGVEDAAVLDGLEDDDIWKILKDHAFGRDVSPLPAYAEQIGKEIVKKLNGLPLAAKAVGRLLGQRLEEAHWQRIQDSGVWDTMKSGKDITLVPALALSFLHLPYNAKPTFTYCSLFSKEQKIKKTELVYQWLAHDYLLDKPEESAEDMGEEILNNLQNMSLVTIQEGSVQMHDLIHDMSTASGRDDHLQVSKDVKNLDNLQEERLRHLRIHIDQCFSKETLEKVGNCSRLRTLICECPYGWAQPLKLEASVLRKWFKQLQRLRVLTLTGFEIEELPEEIRELKHLRYLDLSHNTLEELPVSLVKLRHLQALNLRYLSGRIRDTSFSGSQLSEFFSHLPMLRYLDLSGNDIITLPESISLLSDLHVLLLENCGKLRKLPDGIEKLKRLGRLGLARCRRINKLPEGLGSLTKLTELDLTECVSLGRLGNQLSGLKNLKHLYADRELICDISGLTSLETGPSVLQADEIDQLANLNMLRGGLAIENLRALQSKDKGQQANMENKVNLKELSLDWNDKTTNSLLHTATTRDVQNQQKVLECLKPYNHLTVLEISNYIGRILPNWLTSQYLPFLKRLHLVNLHIEEILMYGDSSEIYPFMEDLELVNLPKLYRWTGQDKSGRRLLPRLRKIKISECPKLKNLPDMPSSLETMKLDTVGLLKLPSLQHHSEEAGEASWGHSGTASSSSSSKPLFSSVQVSSLTNLEVRNCRLLSSLDNGILASQLLYLEKLVIEKCRKLKHPPRNGFKDFESLRNLHIEDCPRLMKLTEKEAEVGLSPHLQTLTIEDCGSLDTKLLQTSPETLEYLKHLILKNCGGIDEFEFVENNYLTVTISNEQFNWKPLLSSVQVSSLTTIIVCGCPLVPSLDNGILASRLPHLERLFIEDCPNLKHPPRNGFKVFESLWDLYINNCPQLMKLTEKEAEVGLPPHLKKLTIKDCRSLDTKLLQTSLETLENLKHLILKNCGGIDAFSFENNHFLETDISNREDNATKIILRNCLRSPCSGLYRCTRFYLEADLVLCDEMLGECFHLFMNNENHLEVNRIYCGREPDMGRGLSLEREGVFIASCETARFLDKGILNYPWPLVRELTIVDYPNLVTPPKRGFITFPCLQSLTLGDCPKLTKLSLEAGSAFPNSLQRLMIYGCDSLEVDSMDDSLQDPLISLQSFVLENGPRHVPNSFVKRVFSRLLQSLPVCTIRSDNLDFKWNQTDGVADIWFKWGPQCIDCGTPKEVLEEMLRRSPGVRRLCVEGYRDVAYDELKKPFLNLTTGDELTIVKCEDLPSLLANMPPQGTYDNRSSSESYDNQRDVCTYTERQEVSLKSLTIMDCIGSQDLSSSLNNHFPWLQELVISNCLNLEDPPKTGFMTFASLTRLFLVNCPKLSKLALEDNRAFPPRLDELRIKNCRGLETESVQTSLDQAAEDKSIRILELENCCRRMTNLFVKDVVDLHLKTVAWCKIRSDDLQLCMFLRKGTGTETAKSCPIAKAGFHWDYIGYDASEEETIEDRVESCSRGELLKHILGHVGPSSIMHLEIHEARDLILVNGMLGQSLHKLINPDTHLALYQRQEHPLREDFGNKDNEYTGNFCIEGCEVIKSLHEGILSYPLPHVRRLLIKNCVNMEDPPARGFSTLTALEILSLVCCPKFTKLSSEDCSALPPSLQELFIQDCGSLEPDSIKKSLQEPSIALRKLVLINSPRCVSNSFVKWMLTRFLSKLSYCEISSTIFKFRYNEIDKEADSGASVSIEWMEENNEDTGDSCSRVDLVVEMLKHIPSHHVKALKIGGLHELKAIESTLKQLLLGLQHLRDLTIVNCEDLCSLPIAEMEDNLIWLRRLQIISCGKLPRLEPKQYPKNDWYYTHTA